MRSVSKQNVGSVGLYRFVPYEGWRNDEPKLGWYETYTKLLFETYGLPFMVSGIAGMRKLSIFDNMCL